MRTLVLLLIGFSLQLAMPTKALLAQETGSSLNIWHDLKHAWYAEWITHPTVPTYEYGVFHFRRTFSLETKPEKFTVFVSADNRYRLFVNGQDVCMGPSRGDLTHWRYETLDIAPYLVAGENIIAAEVVNFGGDRQIAQFSNQTAFILQVEKSNPVKIDTHDDEHWKVLHNRAYSPIHFTLEYLHGFYSCGPHDRVDASKYPWGWKDLDYDDSEWPLSKRASVAFAAGRGFMLGSKWFLVPRTLPFLNETKQRIPQVARSSGVTIDLDESGSAGFLRGEEPLVIPPHTKASILLDQTHHSVGYPELTLSGGKGGEIKITYSEALYGKDRDKGNRNEIEGKEIHGVYDIFLPDGGTDRTYKPQASRAYRFIQFDIQTQDDALELQDYFGVYTVYPFEEKAQFESEDPMLKKIWDMCWLTLVNSAGEVFNDSPYFEQIPYVGDVRIEALASAVVSGDDLMLRKSIQMFDDSRLPCGLTQSRYPSYVTQVTPPYSLLWIAIIHDHFTYFDDPEFVKRFLPGIRGVLEWFDDKVDETGMPTGMEWYSFVDHAKRFNMGLPPGADDGYSAVIALQYVRAAQEATELFRHFGWDHEADKYQKKSDAMREAIYKHCYVPEKGMIAETPKKQEFSQHSQIMAILTDTIPPADQQELMQKTLEDKDLMQVMIYFRFYLFRALQKIDMGDEYLNQIGIWRSMVDQGLTTCAEKDHNPRSDCHGWGSSPNFDFLHTIAGIQSAEPGFRSVLIAPNFGYLDHFTAKWPHPKGMIEVDLSRTESEKVHGTITLPEGLSGHFRWKGQEIAIEPGSQKISLP